MASNSVLLYGQDVVERATKSGAQFTLATLGANATNLLAFHWVLLAGAFGAGFVLSVLTSLASLPVGSTSTASVLSGIIGVPSPPKPVVSSAEKSITVTPANDPATITPAPATDSATITPAPLPTPTADSVITPAPVAANPLNPSTPAPIYGTPPAN